MTTETITGAQIAVQLLPVLTVLGVVSFVFLSAAGILWSLKRIGGTLTAVVRGEAQGGGSKLSVSANGLVGCYLAIVIAEFYGMYFAAHHIFTVKF
jgi:hypothetical protein